MMDELETMNQQLQAALQRAKSGQATAPAVQPAEAAVAPQATTPAAQPTQPPVPQATAPAATPEASDWAQPDIFASDTSSPSASPLEAPSQPNTSADPNDWAQPDVFASGNEQPTTDNVDGVVEQLSQLKSPTEALLGVKPKDADSVLEANKINPDILKDLSFEQLVRLADPRSPLPEHVKQELSDALRGSTTGTLTENLSALTTINPIGNMKLSASPLEQLMEKKYQEYIAANPDKARSLLSRIGETFVSGSPVNNLIEEGSTTLNSETRQQTDAMANSGLLSFGDEVLGVVSPSARDSARESIRALNENEIMGDATIADLVGSIVSGIGIAKGVQGLGSLGVRGAPKSVVGQAALAGALEGGLQSAGAADDGDRLASGSIGALLGAVTGGVTSQVGKTIINRTNSRMSRTQREMVRQLSKDINGYLPKGAAKVTSEEIVDALGQGQNLPRFLAQKGLSNTEVENIINRTTGGNAALMDDLATTARRRMNRMELDASESRRQLGVEVEDASSAIPANRINQIVKEMVDKDSNIADTYINDSLKPMVRDMLKTESVLVRDQMGFKSGNLPDVYVDRKTGKVYLVNRDPETGRSFKASKGGTYPSEKLTEFNLYGPDITSSRKLLVNPVGRDMKEGSVADQERAARVTPFAEQIRRNMNQDARLDKANRAFERALDKQEAISKSARNRDSYIEYTTALERANVPKEFQSQLKFLAKEVDTLRSVGKKANAAKVVNPIIEAINSAMTGIMFNRNLQTVARITGLKYMRDRFFSGTTLSALTKTQREMLPMIRYFINADDAQMNTMLKQMLAEGVDNNEKLGKFIAAQTALIGSSTAGAEPTQTEASLEELGVR